MPYTYHYNLPGYLVWISHILIGAFLLYLGYTVVNTHQIPTWSGTILIILGTLALFYHGHLLILNK
jgi:hypothetical protein